MFLSQMIPSWKVWPYQGKDRTEITIPRDAPPAFTEVPTKEVAGEETAPIRGPLQELTTPQVPHEEWTKVGASPNKFPGWRKVLHPSWLVTATGQASLVLSESRWRHHNQSSGERRARCQRAEEHLQVEQPEQDLASPLPMQEVAPPLGIKEVMACLQRDPLPVTTFEVTLEPKQPEAMVEPTVATMCASHIVQDEAMGITYMDMVTTSVGQVALGSSCLAAHNPQTHHRGHHQPPLRKKLITAFGWKDYHTIHQEHLYVPLWQWGSAALI